MPFVAGAVIVRHEGAEVWRLEATLSYQGESDLFTVPAGFTTDFASVPRPVIWLIPKYGDYAPAAILHDYLCANPDLLCRRDADGLFRRTLREVGVSLVRRWMMWAAVRAGSRLEGISPKFLAVWLCIATLSFGFLAIPVMAVTTALALYWMLESIGYLLERPTNSEANRPSTDVST